MDNLKFEVPEGIYLLNHSVGCMPADMPSIVNDSYLKPWAQLHQPWNNWITALDRFNTTIGKLLNTSGEQVCPQVNLSAALTKILYSLPADSERRTLLASESDFPSLGFVFQQATRSGFNLKFIPSGHDHHDMATWKEAFTDDVFMALVTHVQSNTGVQLPVAEITSLARQRGVITVVDVAQSAGVIPIDLRLWQADFVLGGCVKWLCGGPGASYMWVDENILPRCEPVDVGWFSHSNPFEFDIHHFEYAADAKRFLGGTPCIAPFVMATHSINQIMTIGVDVIHAHNRRLVQRLIDNIRVGTVRSPARTELRSGTAIVDFEDNAAMLQHLERGGIYADSRAQGVRISPHIYNTSEHIDAAVELLNSVG